MIEAKDLDNRLVLALEEVPAVSVADDFALRVMQRLPARRTEALLPVASRMGRRFGFAALALLGSVMFGLAPLAGGSNHQAVMAVEWILCAEFAALTLWLSPVSQLFER